MDFAVLRKQAVHQVNGHSRLMMVLDNKGPAGQSSWQIRSELDMNLTKSLLHFYWCRKGYASQDRRKFLTVYAERQVAENFLSIRLLLHLGENTIVVEIDGCNYG